MFTFQLHDMRSRCFCYNHTATTEIYTLSLHDALPISPIPVPGSLPTVLLDAGANTECTAQYLVQFAQMGSRSEEHTSELQSHVNLVCRLLLEKKKKKSLCSYIYSREVLKLH